jgi:hypothetical protein
LAPPAVERLAQRLHFQVRRAGKTHPRCNAFEYIHDVTVFAPDVC